MQRKFRDMVLVLAAACASMTSVSPSHAQPIPQSASLTAIPKYAAIMIDPQTGEVLYAHQPDVERHPASITKVMTMFLLFEEIRAGRVKMSDRVPFSFTARNQAPSRLGVGAKETISVDEAIQALATKSANDVAYAIAEFVGGSERQFIERMNKRARELGMKSTNFANPTGLPNSAHHSTARDIATLSRAMLSQFPNYYTYFRQRQFTWNGKVMPNHNKLLGNALGVDGIKTGYTVASGFTLAAAASRNGKRLIAVVLGAPTSDARNRNVEALLAAGYAVLDERQQGRKSQSVSSRMNESDFAPSIERAIASSEMRPVSARPDTDRASIKAAVQTRTGSSQRAGASSGGSTLK